MSVDPELLENRVSGLVSFPDVGLIALEFQTFTGGGSTVSDTVRDRGVGEKFAHAVPNIAEIAQITMTRTYRTGRDHPIEEILRPKVGLLYGTAAKVLRDLNLNQQASDTYGVLLEGCTGPDGDANGSGKGMLTLTLGVVSV